METKTITVFCVALVALILAIISALAHAQVYPQGEFPQAEFTYYETNLISNPRLPANSVEVSPIQSNEVHFYFQPPTERPKGLPTSFMLVEVYMQQGEHLRFVGWYWLDAKMVALLHEPNGGKR